MPDPTAPRPILGRIGAVLHVVGALIAYGRYFTATAAARSADPQFPIVAAIFGTHQLPIILRRMQRGILRALALQRYLLARAARGRNLRFAWPQTADLQPHHRPPAPPPRANPDAPRPAPGRKVALLTDDSRASCLPTDQELDAWAKSRPVGRSIACICMDLGIVPSLCDPEFWCKIEKILRRYGGSLNAICTLRDRRERSFQRERDQRPDTWHINWREPPKATVREVLGLLIGQPPPDPPATAPG